jgi:Cu(I)/Ag(I) efflux system membrane protein CusA/SilA
MIAKIIDWCGNNRLIVLIAVAFAVIWGIWSINQVPLDAIPDISDTQVIIFAKWMRSPDVIEDQVSYPIVSSLLGAPKVKAIRAFSDYGFSYIYVIFEDGTDVYWARSRVLEYLSKVSANLPEGVKVELGPDATGVGWVYQYALVDKTGKHSLDELRSYQDWHLRYVLQSIPGVAEVSAIGGFQKQYQIEVNPNALLAYNISLKDVMEAVHGSNNQAGGRLIELSGAEYMVRGRGYIKNISDIENIAVGFNKGSGTPILIKNVANVHLGPEMRRGVADLNGEGETVGGIVTMRYGENALRVIDRVKEKLKEIEPNLPKGVKIETVYDRSELINESIGTLRDELIKLSIAVSIVCLIFLFHLPSALVVILTLPVAIIVSFIAMHYLGVTSNIMSLGGIAIAIGAMVDASIIMVENAHKKLEEWEEGGRTGSRSRAIIEAAKEVGPSLFFALLVITFGFLPIFALEAQEGRLFKPLAYTKTFAMLFSSLLAITLTPVLMTLFIKGQIPHEDKNPVSNFLRNIYDPIARWALDHKKIVIVSALAAMLLTVPIYFRIGSEFMPPLFEGSLLYMPTTFPGISVTEASKLLQVQDKLLKSFPEVERVFGKAGRADTSLDPAPYSMFETTILLKPQNKWRPGMNKETLVKELDSKMQFPGISNSWTMPIKNRIDMLSTGIRTPIGIKILGKDLTTIEALGLKIEQLLKSVKGTRSIYAERVTGGYYIDIDPRREEIARYGLKIEDVNMVIETAIGGEPVTVTIENRERYTVNIRYPRDFRDDIEALKRVLIPAPSGAQIPLAQLADIKYSIGPSMIRDENGLLAGYVYVDMADRDTGSYVREAKQILKETLDLPPGYELIWSGQYEYMQRAMEKLKIMVPLTVAIIFMLIYFNTGSLIATTIVFLAVPFSLVGAFLLLYLLGYNMSVAVWVGIIALAGLDAETGVIMLLYLNLAYEKWKKEDKLKTQNDLKEAILFGAVKRVRPKIMTVAVILAGLLPLMWSNGAGSDLMKRIAAPMVGGITTSLILELLVYPVVFAIWKGQELNTKGGD